MMGSRPSFAIGKTQTISQQITSVLWSLRITNAGPQRLASVWGCIPIQIWSDRATHTTTKYRH